MLRYYQEYNSRLGKWVKIDSETGLIVAVKKSQGEYGDLPKTPWSNVEKRKSFWDFF